MLESAYEEIFCYACSKLELNVKRQHPVSLLHEGLYMGTGYRADVILNDKVLIEIKAIGKLAPVHFAQVLTYLKMTELKLGLLINFNVLYLKDGIHRIGNKL